MTRKKEPQAEKPLKQIMDCIAKIENEHGWLVRVKYEQVVLVLEATLEVLLKDELDAGSKNK